MRLLTAVWCIVFPSQGIDREGARYNSLKLWHFTPSAEAMTVAMTNIHHLLTRTDTIVPIFFLYFCSDSMNLSSFVYFLQVSK
ncbi:hypothetical protein QBC37DRAFT_429395 [Rhypophila decipiens]|uniref:Uncharacterized protein n=1 Tax=Rhypophila decipiens TaxID=261697 RepID=A0AAN6Y2F3_9PEZI|nr:hypothetical protein QBC37DRAFT_429395 [Rhypophila decipiens]